jgi:hypothetical protein
MNGHRSRALVLLLVVTACGGRPSGATGPAIIPSPATEVGAATEEARPAPAPGEPVAPVAARRDHAVPSPHGSRNDPYYWLRDDTRNPEMLAYLAAENAYTAEVLAKGPRMNKSVEDRGRGARMARREERRTLSV